ncbi:hypothetical protein [Streptomyces sp. PsTaAH-124]|uniref:hypothetical protein n=1 Tax=Streptomyces sp. PsTaAH-124 TaxID=1157638 RepID=UPI00035C5C53|nr:hypothetical protein [Streptomyces sp. PsTaAH-124]
MVHKALACADCRRDRATGLWEACDYRRQTRALIGEATLLAAAGSADLTDPGSVTAAAEVRTAIGHSIAAAWQEFLQITDAAALKADPEAARTAVEIARQAVQEHQHNALAMLGRTEHGGRTGPSSAGPDCGTTRPAPSPPPRRSKPKRPGSSPPSTC